MRIFLEHVAFGGSRHFPGKSLQQYLESLGMKYGVDINAFTSQDRTIYHFAVPTDSQRKGVIDSALLILRDWMDGLKICPERVETERGIILEELRGYDVGDPFYDLKTRRGNPCPAVAARHDRGHPAHHAGHTQKLLPEMVCAGTGDNRGRGRLRHGGIGA